MKLYITLDSLLEYSPSALIKNSPAPIAIEQDKTTDSLENILKEKVQCISDILTQINQDVKSRGHLSYNIIYRIYEHYCYLKSKIFELHHWELGSSRSVESRRSSLEKQLDSLKQEKRQEQVQCFKDIMLLKTEHRTWFKQYCDVMQRAKIILADKFLKRK